MDLTTKFGRQQAHAAGGKAHRTACLVEEALAADDRERNEEVLEILIQIQDNFEVSLPVEDMLELAVNKLKGKTNEMAR